MLTKNLRIIYLGLAFINGMVIMALEISSTRLLAPYFGTSIFVWTNVIGVVLGALAVGYFIGGKLSKNNPSLAKLLRLTSGTGLLVLTIPWLIHPLATNILSQNIFNTSANISIVGSFIAITVLFGLPLMLLGITSPYLIRLSGEHAEHIGEIAGKLFAVSTIGSFLGTFLPTLILIPRFGTRNTILACGALLLCMGSLGFINRIQKTTIVLSGILLVGVSIAQTTEGGSILFSTESSYQKIKITEGADRTRYLQFDAGFGIQSVYHPNKILTGLHYYDYYSVLPLLRPQNNKKILIIGLAGGTIARQLNFYYQDSVSIDGVEVDRAVIEASKDYLNLGNIPVTIFNQDGRVFLAQTHQIYDLIIIDAYHNEFEIPWTLTTKEFWEETYRHLSHNGIVAMNIATSTKNKSLLEAFIRTGSTVYAHTYITPTGNEQFPVSNYMISMSQEPVAYNEIRYQKTIDPLYQVILKAQQKTYKAEAKPNALLLTDDKAPIDLLTATTLWPALKGRNQ